MHLIYIILVAAGAVFAGPICAQDATDLDSTTFSKTSVPEVAYSGGAPQRKMSRFLRGYKAEEDMSEEDEERGIVVFDHFNRIAKRMIQETKELIIRLVRSMKLTPAERDALIALDLTRLAKLSGNA
ncbi:hypothetical protein L914_00240 [Phytophthora nicotianae]|uniref:RxLR effector protein n=2 Tax=Phytophthora nicotianae TaxID=4792 RepID=V9G303_PHYNI|nr:hypothetical protein F443_00275 [Phytophthora nicotianae P1569]ETM56854.1 hypothetical protein L914_00240 [Phytophthora nicotianae]